MYDAIIITYIYDVIIITSVKANKRALYLSTTLWFYGLGSANYFYFVDTSSCFRNRKSADFRCTHQWKHLNVGHTQTTPEDMFVK